MRRSSSTDRIDLVATRSGFLRQLFASAPRWPRARPGRPKRRQRLVAPAPSGSAAKSSPRRATTAAAANNPFISTAAARPLAAHSGSISCTPARRSAAARRGNACRCPRRVEDQLSGPRPLPHQRLQHAEGLVVGMTAPAFPLRRPRRKPRPRTSRAADRRARAAGAGSSRRTSAVS